MSLSIKNFFRYYLFNFNAQELTSKERGVAKVASVALFIITAGITHLFCGIALYDRSFKIMKNDDPLIESGVKKVSGQFKSKIGHLNNNNNTEIADVVTQSMDDTLIVAKIQEGVAKVICNANDEGHEWNEGDSLLTEASLFSNICSPRKTRLRSNLHANWLDEEKTMAAFGYPTTAVTNDFFLAMKEAGIERHCHLADDFTVWSKHWKCGPVYPRSSKVFKEKMDACEPQRVGIFSVKYEEIQVGEMGKLGKIKISDNYGSENQYFVPLDSIILNNKGVSINLVDSTDDVKTYVFKNGDGEELHELEVREFKWVDFEAVTVEELHELAQWMSAVGKRSAGCRAGVGRTGTAAIGTMMLLWSREHPGQQLTVELLIDFIGKARVNRNPLVVQTNGQMKLLVQYMNFLNE